MTPPPWFIETQSFVGLNSSPKVIVNPAAEIVNVSESRTIRWRLEKPDEQTKKLQEQLSGLGDRLDQTQARLSVSGTFNALAVRGLGGGSPAERTAKATEETAKNTKKLLQEAQLGELVFS